MEGKRLADRASPKNTIQNGVGREIKQACKRGEPDDQIKGWRHPAGPVDRRENGDKGGEPRFEPEGENGAG